VTVAKHLDALVVSALMEDLAGGDLTTEATVPAHELATATAVAKARLVLSGGEVFARCFYAVDARCRVEQLLPDGSLAEPGAVLLSVEGPAQALLRAERTALNFLQRLSGTATLTRAYVDAAAGSLRITDTRKTTPGLRALERRAVRDGGGHNHRSDLGSAVLIKDNHIAAAGGITAAVGRARAYAPHTSKIEVEVTTEAELREALAAGADIIMLDNFADADVAAAAALARGRALIEVSGNMTPARVAQLAACGVDVISVGALTHSAPAADISLRLRRLEDGLVEATG
jgi:nicotinate-nucleotide pyrophosphorylase (carboxylating)